MRTSSSKNLARSARGRCALVWRALRATLEEMFKLAWRVPNFAMMRGTAPAEAVTPQKPVVQETPVKFRSGKHNGIAKEVVEIAPRFPQKYLSRSRFGK